MPASVTNLPGWRTVPACWNGCRAPSPQLPCSKQSIFAVLFIDLDDFKSINDRLGHGVGDLALQLTGQRLQETIRHTDLVSRHGGEEFLVLLADLPDTAAAKNLADKIGAVLRSPGEVAGHALRLSASIGLAVYPEDGEEAMLLINRADAAMYRAKRLGPGQVVSHGDPAAKDPAALQVSAAAPLPHRAGLAVHTLADLREANERLLISAIDAKARESNLSEAHSRQVKLQAVVAHELRNPLTPIRMAAEMLKLAPEDAGIIAKLPDMIERQVNHMGRLIDDLLDSSRVSAGKFRLDFADVALDQVLAGAIEVTTMAIHSRRQTLNLSIPETLPRLHGDRSRLIQVFSNLLDNASKYTQEAGVITVSVENGDGAEVITIADNGIGIVAEMLPTVFDLFAQDTTALIRDNDGLGIGLAVVKELVHAHGGTVYVESKGRNRGSKFVVTLPLHETADAFAGGRSPWPPH